jgi:RNA polymerase sigma factor (sigma-70 family)
MRDGDRDAAGHLWREFRPAIERKIKFELRKYGLVARGFSEERIQSVALLFFDRLWRGKLDSALERCEKPEQLLNLFRKMAQGKVVDWLRKENAARRDQSKKRPVDGIDPIDNGSTPSQVASRGEQVERANSLLTGEERRIIELHSDHNWDEIAQILDLGKEAVRKRYERAIARVKQQLDA